MVLLLAACGRESPVAPEPVDPLLREVGGKYWTANYYDSGLVHEYWLVSGNSRCFVSPERFERTLLGSLVRCLWEPIP